MTTERVSELRQMLLNMPEEKLDEILLLLRREHESQEQGDGHNE